MKNLSRNAKITLVLIGLFVLLWAGCYLGDLIDEKKDKKLNNSSLNNETYTELHDISLKYGQLGNYGRYITMSGETYIVYEIPSGKYKLTGLSNLSTIFYSSNNIVFEDNQYIYDLLETIKLYKNNTYVLDVQENTNIELSLNSHIAFDLIG